MDQEQLDSLAVTHLLQHTLRSLCIHDNSQWVYAVFWRILPRNYPPPKWDSQGGVYDRSRGNRRNWILVWEDGFCNFAAATTTSEMNASSEYHNSSSSSSAYGNCEYQQHYRGLQPELFFKMSHEIYNYGEGLIGKVAADHSHKWIHKEPNDQEINFLSAWHNTADSQPRTWEAQFQCGIKTIALIAVREGVIQLGAVHKVIEDLSYVVLLRKKFSYIESIPGVLLPHPSSSVFPFKIDHASSHINNGAHQEPWAHSYHHHHPHQNSNLLPQNEYYDHFAQQPMKITPSMSSLEALLSKLPNVVPVSSSSPNHFEAQHQYLMNTNRPMELEKVAKEEYEDADRNNENDGGGETSGSMPSYHHFIYHDELNITSSNTNNS